MTLCSIILPRESNRGPPLPIAMSLHLRLPVTCLFFRKKLTETICFIIFLLPFAGRLAAVNDKVILVTTTEASHIECCKLLDDMIQCDSIDVPKTLVGSKITSTSVALKIKEEKLKYLALCLDVSVYQRLLIISALQSV